MSALTNDAPVVAGPPASRLGAGLVLALVSAYSFGMSGAMARGLSTTAGASAPSPAPGSAPAAPRRAAVRAAGAARPLAPAARQRRHPAALRRARRRRRAVLLLLGDPVHAGRTGDPHRATPRRRPSWSGCGSSTDSARACSPWWAPASRPWAWCSSSTWCPAADLSLPGVLWALGAMVGCATYFIISADERHGMPPIVLAAGGLVVGRRDRGSSGWSASCRCTRRPPTATYAGTTFAWWAAARRAGRGHRRPALRHRRRGRPAARLAAGLVRRARPRSSPACCGPGCCSTSCRAGPARRWPADPGRRGRRSSSASARSRRGTRQRLSATPGPPGVSCAWMWS